MNIPAMRRVATLAVAATLLGGCATMTDWFSGSDNAPKPTPLQAIQNSVTPKVRWDASLGAALRALAENHGTPTPGGAVILNGDEVLAIATELGGSNA